MTGRLNHTPAQILQQLLIDLGHGTSVASGGNWPVYFANLPDTPEQAIGVADSSSITDGREMVEGEVAVHVGAQILVRSSSSQAGYVKGNQILIGLDQDVVNTDVILDSSTYTMKSISRTSDVLSLGPEVGVSRRYLHSLNVVMSLRLVAEADTGTGS